MSYVYFLSITYKTESGYGFANCEMNFSNKITSLEDIDRGCDFIKKEHKEFSSVCILNYQLLRVED